MAKSGKQKSGNAGRVNNDPSYKDRESLDGAGEYLGEDIRMKKGKGGYRKRLANEIDDNAYDSETKVEVIDDPKLWGKDYQMNYNEVASDRGNERYQERLKKYIKIIKRTYDWLRESEVGQKMFSLVEVRASIGMSKSVWDNAKESSEEFEYYADLILDVIAARLHHSGVNSQGNQVFKIFSLKNQLPDEFADKKEVNQNQRIEVIQIKQGTEKDVKKAIDQSKKRLKE